MMVGIVVGSFVVAVGGVAGGVAVAIRGGATDGAL